MGGIWPRSLAIALLVLGKAVAPLEAESPTDLGAGLEADMATAEGALKQGKTELAQARYHAAMAEGWLLMGDLQLADERLEDARAAFKSASGLVGDDPKVLYALAQAHVYMGENAEAVRILESIFKRDPTNAALRNELGTLLVASGRAEEAVLLWEQAHRSAPEDLEVSFSLANAYLKAKRTAPAENLFDEVAKERPIAATHVFIGSAYGEAGEYVRAKRELTLALKLDPHAKRAHYFLGLAALASMEGTDGLEGAVSQFRAELSEVPDERPALLRLGMALVEFPRPQEALPILRRAVDMEPSDPKALYFLGRCQLALHKPEEAEATLRRALELTEKGHGSTSEAGQDNKVRGQLGALHNELGLALTRLGKADEAAGHFDAARRLADQAVTADLETQRQYFMKEADTWSPSMLRGPFSQSSPQERGALKTRVTAALARAYMNMGLVELQATRYTEAADLLEVARGLDADFPKLEYTLGVALFNSQKFSTAIEPLNRAALLDPENVPLRRMLAIACLNAKVYDRAAQLLARDPDLGRNASLQFAYATALSNSGRLADATAVFQSLVTRHQDSAELNVVMAQAHAKDGDFTAAVQAATRALELNPSVPEANDILGGIFLEQGKLEDAEKAYRAELKIRPDSVPVKHNLALTLESEQKPDEAVVLLRSALASDPLDGDAHYLLGKIILAQGNAKEALEHLETALRLKPQDANVHYQLGRTYQKLGRAADAQKEFDVFRDMKAAKPDPR